MGTARAARGLGWMTAAAAVGALAALPLAGAAPGDRDGRYGDRGLVVTDFRGQDDVGRAIALQADGKIVVAGSSPGPADGDFAVARYNPDGSLDPSFGTGGRVTTDFGGSDEAAAVAVDREGRIVVSGYGQPGDNADLAVARYQPDGSLDPSFGTGGKVTTDLGRQEDANAVAIQPDGRIVVAGCAKCQANASNFAVARYQPDGRLDPSFGAGGVVTTDFGAQADEANAVAVLPDGRVLAAGFAAAYRPTGIGPGSRNANFGLARYLPDGRLDPGFGERGLTATDFADGNDSAAGLAVQPDGKVVAAGLGFVDGGFKFVLSRYGTDGSLDALFGRGGKVVTAFRPPDRQVPGDGSIARGASANAVALGADGTILAAGVDRDAESDDFALARYTPAGTLDSTFGRGGLVVTDFAATQDEAFAVALAQDGRILTAGASGRGGIHDFALGFYRGGLLVDPTVPEPTRAVPDVPSPPSE